MKWIQGKPTGDQGKKNKHNGPKRPTAPAKRKEGKAGETARGKMELREEEKRERVRAPNRRVPSREMCKHVHVQKAGAGRRGTGSKKKAHNSQEKK